MGMNLMIPLYYKSPCYYNNMVDYKLSVRDTYFLPDFLFQMRYYYLSTESSIFKRVISLMDNSVF